jgi:IS5 family transposase
MQGKSDPNRELLDAAALCRQLVAEGSVEAFLADHRHQLFPDEMFADLFPSGRGRPSIPADVIATAMVLQALEGLSDREAARAVRDRISWKVACGLALDDDGFDYSVFTYWRTRLRHSEHPERIFDAVREVIDATGVLAGRRRRALDSTILDDAVATQDTVTQLISAIRRVRRLVPEAAQVTLSAHDYDAGAKPVIAWDDPVAKQALITALVADALALVTALEPLTLSGAAADAVGLLALVAGQDVEPGDEPGTWRIARRVAPDRTISTVDPEARHTRKSPSQPRDGYKAHLAVEPETGLITDAVITPANTSDAEVAPELLKREEAGVEVLGDSAYGCGHLRAGLDAAGHAATIKPMPSRPAVPGGFARDDFVVDYETNRVTCPAGVTVTFGRGLRAKFGSHCTGCPLRAHCTTSPEGRSVALNVYDVELEAARRRSETEEFQLIYRRWRPMVERTIAWLVAGGNRRLRYRGVARNHQWLLTRTAALNLRRLVNLGLDHNGAWMLAT